MPVGLPRRVQAGVAVGSALAFLVMASSPALADHVRKELKLLLEDLEEEEQVRTGHPEPHPGVSHRPSPVQSLSELR